MLDHRCNPATNCSDHCTNTRIPKTTSSRKYLTTIWANYFVGIPISVFLFLLSKLWFHVKLSGVNAFGLFYYHLPKSSASAHQLRKAVLVLKGPIRLFHQEKCSIYIKLSVYCNGTVFMIPIKIGWISIIHQFGFPSDNEDSSNNLSFVVEVICHYNSPSPKKCQKAKLSV